MAAPQKFVLRVCVATDVAMKLILTERPQSVDELENIMQEKFKPRLDCDFTFNMRILTSVDSSVFLWIFRSSLKKVH